MNTVLGDYGQYIEQVEAMVQSQGIAVDELAQCDMVNYECSTVERYEEVKSALLQSAILLSEIEHGGRLISIY